MLIVTGELVAAPDAAADVDGIDMHSLDAADAFSAWFRLRTCDVDPDAPALVASKSNAACDRADALAGALAAPPAASDDDAAGLGVSFGLGDACAQIGSAGSASILI